MKKTKKVTALLLVAIMLMLPISGCNKAGDASSSAESGTVSDPDTQYSGKRVTVNGIPLEEIKISVVKKTDREHAELIQAELKKHNGYSVPIVAQEELSGDEKLVICLGSFDREKTNPLASSYKGYRITVTSKGGYTVGIMGSGATYYKQAVDRFISEMKASSDSEGVNITLPSQTIQQYKYDLQYGEEARWVMHTEKTVEEKISDGLTYKEYYYTDGEGDNYVVNALYVDTEKYSFYLGLPAEGTNFQTVTEQMKNASASELNVVAGINGDRWDTWLGTGRIHGLTVQNGKLIDRGLWDGGVHSGQSLGDKPYFALTKDGEYVIGARAGTADISKISMAIGGDYMLVDKAVPVSYSDFFKYQPTDENHVKLYHPRTLVGITDDGNLILVTIDGRQKPRATGASLETCADLMASLGCYMATSLDGGGSTEMVVKYADEYSTKNIPSDGRSRAVKNSLLIVEK